MSGVGKKDTGIVKQESRTESKNWILKIHAKWLKITVILRKQNRVRGRQKTITRLKM